VARWLLVAVLIGIFWALDAWFFNGFYSAAVSREVSHVAEPITDWAQSIASRIRLDH